MKIPEFTPKAKYLRDEIELNCLFAKVKSSCLGVGSEHNAEFKEDPDCEIYLRSKREGKISAWQQEVLGKLFDKNGVAAAVTEAMKEYETSSEWGGKNYADVSVEYRQKIKKHGIAPHITIFMIAIDEVMQEVILRADTVVDGNLEEHGISIYLKKGRWRFDTAEYFDHYAATLFGTEKEQEDYAKRLWDNMYPLTTDSPVESDLGLMLGDWILNKPETHKLMKVLKWGPGKVRISLLHEECMSVKRDNIREFAVTPPLWDTKDFHVIRCERRGKRVKVQLRRYSEKEPYINYEINVEYWCDGNVLVSDVGLVFQRKRTEDK